jgi:heat shock protein HslJ
MMSTLTTRLAVSFSFGLVAALDPGISFGCTNSSPEPLLAQKQGTEYQLTRFIGSSQEIKLPAKPALTLTLVSPERVAGFAGVNRYFGSYQIGAEGRVYWRTPGFGSTLMAGPKESMDLEQLFLQSMARTECLQLGGSNLRFETQDGGTRLEFVERAKLEALAAVKDTKFLLVRMVVNSSDLALDPNSPITLLLAADGHASGSAAINRYHGGYTLSDDGNFALTGPLATTRMAGPPELMALEDSFLKALGTVTALQPAEGGAALWNDDRSVLLEFRQQ